MIKNELSKYYKNVLMNPAEAAIVVRVLPRDLRMYDRLIVGLGLWYDFLLYLMLVSCDLIGRLAGWQFWMSHGNVSRRWNLL